MSIKAVIGWSGDNSVGIPDYGMEVDTGLEDMEDCDRAYIREKFQSIYHYMSGELPEVLFSDECAECGSAEHSTTEHDFGF